MNHVRYRYNRVRRKKRHKKCRGWRSKMRAAVREQVRLALRGVRTIVRTDWGTITPLFTGGECSAGPVVVDEYPLGKELKS
jgi:hypothetical protein